MPAVQVRIEQKVPDTFGELEGIGIFLSFALFTCLGVVSTRTTRSVMAVMRATIHSRVLRCSAMGPLTLRKK